MSEFRLSTTSEYLDWAFKDCGIIELRHQDGQRWHTGWFDNSADLLREARGLSSSGGLYTSLNAPKLRKGTNRMSGQPMRDADIAFITRLFFDFDPARPTGVCSIDAELAQAFEARNAFVAYTRRLGWPIPLHALSGNGYHAQYRCRLPNTDETREQLRLIYYGLHADVEYAGVEFDKSVRNPGRICRLYGSTNRKGPNTPERPHRKSAVWIPPEWKQVTQRQVEQLASYYARQQAPQRTATPRPATRHTGQGDYRSLDVVGWFRSHGLHKRSLGGGKHAVTCPWVSEHSSPDHPHATDTVAWEADGGWPTFYCSHSHCEGRGLQDVMATLGDADAFCTSIWEGKAQ